MRDKIAEDEIKEDLLYRHVLDETSIDAVLMKEIDHM